MLFSVRRLAIVVVITILLLSPWVFLPDKYFDWLEMIHVKWLIALCLLGILAHIMIYLWQIASLNSACRNIIFITYLATFFVAGKIAIEWRAELRFAIEPAAPPISFSERLVPENQGGSESIAEDAWSKLSRLWRRPPLQATISLHGGGGTSDYLVIAWMGFAAYLAWLFKISAEGGPGALRQTRRRAARRARET
jgi:hypothetical protein